MRKNEKVTKLFASKLEELKNDGLFNTIRVLEKPNQTITQIDGKRILNFNSNNFLGFASDPKIINASIKALIDFGVGPGAVRSISGSLDLHRKAEKMLAEFKGAEDCILVQSGFQANTTLIPTVFGADDCVISDSLNHASIIDGIRLSKANKKIYQHANMDDLEAKVKEARSEVSGMVVIITDGVFSMDGAIANLPEIVKIARANDAMIYVDDAWGELGLGKTGRGTPQHFDLESEIDFEVGTLSKGFGVQGGFITGSKELIGYLRQRGRPFIFSTGLGPAEAGAVIAVLKELNESTARIDKLHENQKYFADGIRKLGFELNSETQIIPLMIKDEKQTQAMSKALFEEGIFVTPIVFPTVPKGTARCRFIVSAEHTKDDLDECLDKIEKCAKKLGII